jgi:hypothetical protein
VVVLIVLVFLVEEDLSNVVGLPRLEVVVVGGAAARGVLPRVEIVPELAVPVLAVEPQRLGKVPDAAPYLHIQLRPRRWRRRNRHPRTVDVPAVGEADIVVVDALVACLERLALLERHIAPIALLQGRGRRVDGRPPAPRNPLATAQERWRWTSRRPWASSRRWRDGGLLLRRVPWLDDASWSFFAFFRQDDIFMTLALALYLWEEVTG